MAIGPEARRMASGRVVVLAASQGFLSIVTFVMGLGPLVHPSEPVEKLAAGAAVALSVPMGIGAVLLGLRRGPARTAGLAAAFASMAVGTVVVVLAVASLDGCGGVGDGWSCSMLIGLIGLVGIGIIAFGIGSRSLIRRAHPRALRHDDL